MSARRIFSELKRRRVFRVAAGYTVVGIAVAETLDLILPRLGAPDWVVTVFIVALLVGFPIALVLGWALEVTPEGIRVTDPVEDSGPDGEAPVRHGMAGYAMVFVLGVWWLVGWEGDGGEDATTVRSLAVLPFSALSDESSDQWLAQGLHDQLITELAHLSGLDRVISRTSVLRFAEDPPSIIEIAQALNVDAIIEGTILPSTDRVRINVQLIDGVTDAHLWARDYDRAREEALDLVKSVAQDIAGEIALQLSATDEAHLQTERSVNPVAQEAYFRGRSFWNERTSEGMRQAAEQFQRAHRHRSGLRAGLCRDGEFACPWVGWGRHGPD